MRTHRKNINEVGHAHELTFSCYRRFPFLKAERTCHWLCESINEARIELNFLVWAYVFMPDHVHMIVLPNEKDYDIADIRQSIKAPIALKAIQYLADNAPHWLPRITRKRGRKSERLFWQSGGGYDRNIIQQKALLSMIDYIHNNPVRKRFVLRPCEWKWSSAAWFNDLSPIPLAVDPIPPEWLE